MRGCFENLFEVHYENVNLPTLIHEQQGVGWGEQTSWIKPPSLPAPILANFPARSGRQASKPPFDAARKYDEVGIQSKKTAEKNVYRDVSVFST